jgi:predicted branched-subunit amino acid permease
LLNYFVKPTPNPLQTTTPWQTYKLGVVSALPVMLGLIPFGLVTGVAGIKAGLSAFEITVMSGLVFAGAAQLVALELMGTVSVVLVLLAVAVVNLRYVMYSSAIAKHLKPLSQLMRLVAAALLVDQNFALTLHRHKDLGEKLTPWFYLGVGTPIWFNWVLFTFLGTTLGTRVDEGWSLDFAVPLCFLVLLIPAIKTRPTLVAALVGGITATALSFLPYRSGLFIGAVMGIVAGAWLEVNREAKS